MHAFPADLHIATLRTAALEACSDNLIAEQFGALAEMRRKA
ncbi:hypothetical protein [Streptomyces sp. RPT161]|nr:hypothetical protein [Streptomyces sp. RPT161]